MENLVMVFMWIDIIVGAIGILCGLIALKRRFKRIKCNLIDYRKEKK